ncbi:tetratricopeptide repeat protein [Thermobifida halotolerans]|uniref:Tetratricopeptide repeat protein n=1 Tax=Thermobifida halotolerans TaxID=483545 RepID=A0A399G222_9ACTN|nr:tetratricopeptide repeat protein [Thermobifida halotolerans]UOE20480.1 tetratricopeptide repeat protein [Thermobifida halotolerans]
MDGQQFAQALNSAQQAAQHSGVQVNTFIGALQAKSVASAAPPIALPQRRIPPALLRGRTETLRLAEKQLVRTREAEAQAASTVVLHGIGGVGKTTLALELAHRAAARGTRVWWLNGSSTTLLTAALHALAFAAGAADTEFDHAHPADVLWNNLNSYGGPWLVVLDNVDDPDVLSVDGGTLTEGTGWLRPTGQQQGSVLVTSRDGRRNRWPSWTTMLPVESLTPDDGAQVLLDLAPEGGTHGDARALAAALGGVPLALELAGRYLASAATDPFPPPDAITSFPDYQAFFEQRVTALPLDEAPPPGDRDRRVLSTTWEISLDLLTDQGHEFARPLLRLLACSAATPLPYRPFLDLRILGRHELFAGVSHGRLGGSLRALAGLGLISFEAVDGVEGEWGRAITLHPLVRAVTRGNLKRSGMFENCRDLFLDLLEAVSTDLDPEDTRDWPRWELLAEHALAALSSAAEAPTPDRGRVARALRPALGAAWYQYMAGRYERSTGDLSTIYAAVSSVFGPEDLATLRVRNRLARSMRERGHSAAAEKELRAALETARRVLGDEHPETLNIRVNLARTIRERGDSATAQTEFADISRVARRVLGDNHPDTLAATYNLARTLRDQQRYAEAEPLYREALTARLPAFPATDLTTLDLRYELAETLRERGAFQVALKEYREVLAVANQVYSAHHPNTLIIRHGLALALLGAGQVAEAENELAAILDIRRSVLGEDHPATRQTERELRKTTRPDTQR